MLGFRIILLVNWQCNVHRFKSVYIVKHQNHFTSKSILQFQHRMFSAVLSISTFSLIVQLCNSNIEYSHCKNIKSTNNIRTSAGDGSKGGGAPKGMSDISTFKSNPLYLVFYNSEVVCEDLWCVLTHMTI